ncbi:MAG: M24 family metallopeptidase [Anaerolineae bacterium]
MTEYQIAGLLAGESFVRGVTSIVNLIASDERVLRYRHPIPTDRVLERYAMLVLCGRCWGLVASATRLVHFGPLPDELRHKGEALARVDAAFIAATRPGARLAEVFGRAVETYAAVGFPDEWQLHHQGGAAGYEPREFIATPASTEVVEEGQAFAWNPSITGTKSEDTIVVGAEGNEIITATGEWPPIPVELEGQVLHRPAILEVA